MTSMPVPSVQPAWVDDTDSPCDDAQNEPVPAPQLASSSRPCQAMPPVAYSSQDGVSRNPRRPRMPPSQPSRTPAMPPQQVPGMPGTCLLLSPQAMSPSMPTAQVGAMRHM